jgi:hypothetical protein
MDDDPQGDFEDRTQDEVGDSLDDHPEFDPEAAYPTTGGRGCLLLLALPLLAGLCLCSGQHMYI